MKSRAHFQFRRFAVADDQCSMKVGTDAVLLAAWADLGNARRILDIGTGSGVIALIAAQRTEAGCLIDGVEVQPEDCAQARANVAASPWPDRVKIISTAVQDFRPPHRYDIILCNPPYFINSLRPPGKGRTTARHTIALDHPALIDAVDRLMSGTGSANFIMPPEEGSRFRTAMEASGMRTQRIWSFRTRAGKKIERILFAFSRAGTNLAGTSSELKTGTFPEADEICLYATGDQWTTEYSALTRELYLPRSGSLRKSRAEGSY